MVASTGVTPNGPSPDVYARRRAAVLDQLERAVLFLPGAPETIYSNDVHYPYRPDSYVRYLTGLEEPGALILARTGGDSDGYSLFVRPRDPQAETWTGERTGVEGAQAVYGADRAFPLDALLTQLEKSLARAERFYFAHARDTALNQKVFEVVHRVNCARPRGGGRPLVTSEAGAVLDEMRLRKSVEEIALLRRACSISASAHRRVMERVRPDMHEYEVQAIVEHEFRVQGCSGPAYGTIAAGGANATVLHYVRNDRVLRDGELLLLDAGGEYGGYAADITRTMPVGSSWSWPQREIYDIVLGAQLAAIAAVSPEVTHEHVHKTAVRELVAGMIRIGLLRGTTDEVMADESYKRFYMHGTGHWLGMDVHDVGSYREGEASRTLQPGFVTTVEPGIYVRADADVPDEYRGIGVRIEDDVVVTGDSCEILTADVPKDAAEIEALRRHARP
jgi:Xaa-Pro aminopeptidase